MAKGCESECGKQSEFQKKDLRTADVVTYRNGEERTLVFNLPDGDWFCNGSMLSAALVMWNEDLTHTQGATDRDIMKVTRNGKVIYERKEGLQYGKVYDFGANSAVYASNEKLFYGFDRDGKWFVSTEYNFPYLTPGSESRFSDKLIEYAKSRGYKNGNYKCLSDDETQSISGNPTFEIYDNGSVWIHGKESRNMIMDTSTGKWAEIIPNQSELSETSIDELISELKKRTGANHIQLCYDK